ncbi:MAG: hypothetical protein ACI4MJ_01180 [Aristaeellaceae bacterium]
MGVISSGASILSAASISRHGVNARYACFDVDNILFDIVVVALVLSTFRTAVVPAFLSPIVMVSGLFLVKGESLRPVFLMVFAVWAVLYLFYARIARRLATGRYRRSVVTGELFDINQFDR